MATWCERIVITGEIGGRVPIQQRCPAAAVPGHRHCAVHLAELEGRLPPPAKRPRRTPAPDVLPWSAEDQAAFTAAPRRTAWRRG